VNAMSIYRGLAPSSDSDDSEVDDFTAALRPSVLRRITPAAEDAVTVILPEHRDLLPRDAGTDMRAVAAFRMQLRCADEQFRWDFRGAAVFAAVASVGFVALVVLALCAYAG